MIPEIQPGTIINSRYIINKVLGQGGFGRTYLAADTQRFNELCVLKEFVPATTKEEIINKSRELFEREAKVLYQIQHPQIPRFSAWMMDSQRLFIVQEFIDGKTYAQILYERLSQGGKPFSEGEARTWLLDILPVLEYIHKSNIIHRDISLENIMLPNKQTKPVLIDFGIVKEKMTEILSVNSPDNGYGARGSVVGKAGYSPPEQLRLGYSYPCSDIYALGVSVAILLTARMPNLLIDDSLNWQWRKYTKVSDSFAAILNKMLAASPKERYQSATEVIAQLNLNSPNHNSQPNQAQANQTSQNQILQNQTSQNQILQNQTSQNQASQAQKITQNSQGFFGGIVQKLLSKTGQANQVKEQQLQQLQVGNKTTTIVYTEAQGLLQPEFLNFCQQQLISSVGPFASTLIKYTLEKTPDIEPEEFVEVLAAAIPEAQRAEDFRNSVKLSLETNYQNSQESLNNFPAISNPEFLDQCRRELASFIGPLASVILRDALDEHPNLTPKELIDTLVAEIPNQERAQMFRKRIDKTIK
jgi:serine/threonine protein kinase